MPLLDVTDVILDPMFVDTATYTRRVQTIGLDGLAVNDDTTASIYGVVTSDRGDILHRLADGSRVTGSIIFHTITRLQSGGAGFDADILTWDGRQYTVVNVNSYSRYGRGFVACSCDLIPLAG
jgi:galactose-6-phosphate isomerase